MVSRKFWLCLFFLFFVTTRTFTFSLCATICLRTRVLAMPPINVRQEVPAEFPEPFDEDHARGCGCCLTPWEVWMRTRAWLAVPVMIFLLMAVAIPWEMLCIGAVSAFCVLVQWGCEASGVTKRLDELSQPLLTWIDALDNSRASASGANVCHCAWQPA